MRVIPEHAKSSVHLDILLTPTEVKALLMEKDLFAQSYTLRKDYYIRISLEEEQHEEKQVEGES